MTLLPDSPGYNPAGISLLPRHLADLRASGLTDEQIRVCGFYSCSDTVALARLLGRKNRRVVAALGPCLCIPFPNADGSPSGYVRCKPDAPRVADGKPVKYESPVGTPNRAYFPPATLPVLADPSVPLLITEGEKKAAKADQEGFPCVGLVGVWAWQQKRTTDAKGKKVGPRELIHDLAGVPVRGRRVTIAFDSDLTDKPDVARAEREFASQLREAGADVRRLRLPSGPCGAKVGLDDYLVGNGPAALAALVAACPADETPAADASSGSGTEDAKRPPSAADILTEIGLGLDLWHDATLAGYATTGRTTLGIRSKGFRHYLVNEYRKQRGGKVPNEEALKMAQTAIEAAAVHDGPERPVFVRVARHGAALYLHLADAASTVIEIDANGWRVCDAPPVRFRKPGGMSALPMPLRGGSLAALRNFVNVPVDNSFALVVAWACAALRSDGPFPILVLFGEQGSAKTTTARVLKRLIDPSAAPVRSEPRESRDLMIQARNGAVVAFDNLSYLPPWLSDALCRLATGGGFSTRELYSNDDEAIFDAMRPAVLNGIEEFVTRADLLERSLLIRHPPIPEDRRRPESAFWAEFESAHPELLGALLDRISAGLRELPQVVLPRLPRMADFALFAVACERGAGEHPRFLAAYAENQRGAHEQALGASPIPAALDAMMSGRDDWRGTPAALFAELTRHATNPPPKDWPKKPNALTNKLRRLAPNIRRVYSLDVDCDCRTTDRKRTRDVTVTRICGVSSSAPSAPPSVDDSPGEAGVERGGPADGGTAGAAEYRPAVPSAAAPQQPRPTGDADGADDETRPFVRTRYRNNDKPFEWG